MNYCDPSPEVSPRNTGMVRIEEAARQLNGHMIEGDTIGAEMVYRGGERLCILDFGLGNEFGKLRRDGRPIIVQLDGESEFSVDSPEEAVTHVKAHFESIRRRSR